MVEITCPIHPKYQAKRAPRDCPTCRRIWDLKQYIEKKVIVKIENEYD